MKRVLRTLGLAYLAYHALGVVYMAAGLIQDPDIRRPHGVGELGELLLFPVFWPALFVCGGPHGGCDTGLAFAAVMAVFVLTVALLAIGVWALLSTAWSWWRRA